MSKGERWPTIPPDLVAPSEVNTTSGHIYGQIDTPEGLSKRAASFPLMGYFTNGVFRKPEGRNPRGPGEPPGGPPGDPPGDSPRDPPGDPPGDTHRTPQGISPGEVWGAVRGSILGTLLGIISR